MDEDEDEEDDEDEEAEGGMMAEVVETAGVSMDDAPLAPDITITDDDDDDDDDVIPSFPVAGASDITLSCVRPSSCSCCSCFVVVVVVVEEEEDDDV